MRGGNKTPLEELTLEGEIWKPVPDFPKYLVSNYGRVYSNNKCGLISMSKENFCSREKRIERMKRSYYAVRLYSPPDIGKTFFVHRLVASVFCENDAPETKIIVDHIDNDPLNNMASNLRWVTPWANTHAARTDETQAYTRWLIQHIGRKNGNA